MSPTPPPAATGRPRSRLLRALKIGGIVLLLLALGAGFLAWRMLRVETVRIDEHLHVLLGGGGNTLLLDSPEGALVVDTKFSFPASHLQKEAQRLTGKPVKMVIDTHYHFDHTGGNPLFPGAEFVGAPRTREHLIAKEALFRPGAAGEKMLPTTLVSDGKQWNFGDDYVDVRYLGVGHTDGDLVVFLHKRSILHTGDLFVNGFYPVMDPEAGGSYRALGPTLDKVIAIGAQQIIPGHGPIAAPEDLKRFREYVGLLWDHVLSGVRSGKSRDEVAAGFDAARFHLEPIYGFSSVRKNLDAAFDEATAWLAAQPK
ncbi:MAG: MBL fold metallo-hydrolase [Myxococcales bacterium]|nr:MBL fold metallo-hydrolase [Myxococcales bacterium]